MVKFEILVTQIAGLLARRVISWTDLGKNLAKGELYGMIKFGSCTEVFVPKSVEITVQKRRLCTWRRIDYREAAKKWISLYFQIVYGC